MAQTPVVSQGRAENADAPWVIAPAPPLMRRLTRPSQDGQEFSSGSDIFCRRSKWLPHSRHWYSYAGMGRLLPLIIRTLLVLERSYTGGGDQNGILLSATDALTRPPLPSATKDEHCLLYLPLES
jgi:hypothetical protein